MKNYWIVIFALFLTLSFTACDEDPFSFEADFSTVPAPYDTTGAQRIIKPSGLIIYIHSEGIGESVITERDRVLLYYTLRLKNGRIVDSSYANGRFFPVEFSLPTVIRGFREGLVGAKNGARISLVIPPALGYGPDPESSLRNETLYYDILIDTILD
jgi:FKBP-type peptidyl-prolyl cis-trans isomerase